ncbi:hypothetical protein [Streptomyces coelicoflavus]|uniref:hypothetical protein n=1 Tax=Streptomyces coelicoflavus TaxID=285562 RepID=UPI0015830BFF|nr:hypothetical protein [Streptomyces coelicoflavus]
METSREHVDCGRVVVTLKRNDLGGVDRVRIQDDGYGMFAEDCEEYFRPIGSPWVPRSAGPA